MFVDLTAVSSSRREAQLVHCCVTSDDDDDKLVLLSRTTSLDRASRSYNRQTEVIAVTTTWVFLMTEDTTLSFYDQGSLHDTTSQLPGYC